MWRRAPLFPVAGRIQGLFAQMLRKFAVAYHNNELRVGVACPRINQHGVIVHVRVSIPPEGPGWRAAYEPLVNDLDDFDRASLWVPVDEQKQKLYIRPIRTRITTIIKMMPSVPPG